MLVGASVSFCAVLAERAWFVAGVWVFMYIQAFVPIFAVREKVALCRFYYFGRVIIRAIRFGAFGKKLASDYFVFGVG